MIKMDFAVLTQSIITIIMFEILEISRSDKE